MLKYVGDAGDASCFLNHTNTLKDRLIKYLYHYKFTPMHFHITYILT